MTLLDPVLVALGDALDTGGDAVVAAGGARVLRDKVATAALKACVAVLERLLLDGGRSRSFSTADAPSLLADVRLVRDFFMAMDGQREAQGLEELSVHEATARLQGLVLMMRHSTLKAPSWWCHSSPHRPLGTQGFGSELPQALRGDSAGSASALQAPLAARGAAVSPPQVARFAVCNT